MKKNTPLSKEKKTETTAFQRINTKFKEYWKLLFLLISIYIASYLVWILVFAASARGFFSKHGWGKEKWWMLLGVGLLQGFLFCLDGFVTAWLKAPFNQMCYAVNKASEEEISYENKDYIIRKATESNEHCKETLKKFGILTITQELIRVFVLWQPAGDEPNLGPYWYWINISYLIPLIFTAIAVFLIHKRLKALKKNIQLPTKIHKEKLTS